MPNWIMNSVNVCVPKGVDSHHLIEFKELVGNDFSFEKISPMPEELEGTDRFIDNPNYHTWRLENWGCKWEAQNVTFIYDHWQYAQISCFFWTPWSPPEAICAKLRRDFPELLIQWIWYDMDDFDGCFTL